MDHDAKRYGVRVNGVRFSPDALTERPEFATKIAAIMAGWALAEASLAASLGILMRADYRAASALLGRISTAAARSDALKSVARAVLSDSEFAPVADMVGQFKQAATKRNEIAHGLWGVKPEDEDAVFLMNPKELTGFLVSMAPRHMEGSVGAAATELAGGIQRYDMEKLEGVEDEIARLCRLLIEDRIRRSAAETGHSTSQ